MVPADPNPWRKWLLPVVLAVIIIAVLAGAFLATHPHVFGSSATDTPTPTSAPTRTPKPTATAKVVTKVITATPRPTATETPQPTFTPTPSATPTPTGPPTGAITYPKTQLDQWQQGANQNNPSYTLDRNVYKAMRVQLTGLGYKGQVTVVSPPEPPSPTPTPFIGATGLPQVKITIEWQGKRYSVVMTQPVQQGPSGIWAISHITLM